MQSHSLVIVALAVLALATVPVLAQSASELLEKGVYLEETAGQVAQAMEAYRQIAQDATAPRAVVAEALLRLGVCHLQAGEEAAASEAFERILADFPEQGPFVERARSSMPGAWDALELLPAPWIDGEVLRLSLKRPSGVPIGVLFVTADGAAQGGEELWRLRTRFVAFSDDDYQGLQQVLTRRDTMAPVASVVQQTGLGHFEAEYGDGVVRVATIGADARREQALDGQIFDSNELLHLLRRLPLAVGYRGQVRLVSTADGSVTPVDFHVTGKERIQVPAGELEGYRTELSLSQVVWLSTDPSRTVLKIEASGFVAELEEVYDPGREREYQDEEFGVSLSLPPDWLVQMMDDQGSSVLLLLLDPNAEAQARMEIRRSPADAAWCSYQASAFHQVKKAQKEIQGFILRDGTWSERHLAGWPSVSFVGEYGQPDRDRVYYWTFVENRKFCVEFTLRLAADRFEEVRGAFDSILAGYEAPPPAVEEVSESETQAAVRAVVTDFHQAASEADRERFFAHLAEDAVFFGPGATDRFDVERLRERFTEVIGWMAEPTEQHFAVSDDETLAWFDERLASRRLGELRTSGVLRPEAGAWKIVQFHVALPVPNGLLEVLARKLRAHDAEMGRAGVDFSARRGEGKEDAASPEALLRDVHRARGEPDFDRYFDHFAPAAIVFGTDRSERLNLGRWRARIGPYFEWTKGVTSIPLDQRVYPAPSGDMAWFEELIENEHLGRMRGTGVLKKVEGRWKLLHYNQVVLIPKAMAEDVARRIEAFYAPKEG